MSLSDFNTGMDKAYLHEEPDPKKMANSRDYFEGYCYGDSINQRYDEERRYEEECNRELDRQYDEELRKQQEELNERE